MTLRPLLLLAATLVSTAAAAADAPERAVSQKAVFAFPNKTPVSKVLDIAAIPFVAPSGPVFDISNIHIVATRQATGVLVETRITGSPYKRHSTSDGTPFVITLKAGNQNVATLSPIEWTVTCYRTDIFGAKTLVPTTAFERIDSVEVAPMQATSRVCVSPPLPRKKS